MLRRFILAFAWLFALSVSAQPTLLPEGEKVGPIRLLEFRDDPGHFIFVGKSELQYNIFDVRNGEVHEILMVNGSVMYDGGSLLLDLEGGRHLFVPSDQSYNYVNGRQTSYLVYPDRARDQLQKVNLNRTHLVQLGLGHLLKSEEEPERTPPKHSEEDRELLPQDAHIMFLSIARMNKDSKAKAEEILSKLVGASSGCMSLDKESRRLYMDTFVIACAPDKFVNLRHELTKLENVHVLALGAPADVFASGAEFDGVTDAMASLSDADKPFSVHVSALRNLLLHKDQWKELRGSLEFAKTIWGTHAALTQLNIIAEAIGDTLLMDLKWKMKKEKSLVWDWKTITKIDTEAREKLKASGNYQSFIVPLRGLFIELLDGVRRLGLDESTRIVLLQAGGADGEALPQLLRPWSPNAPDETMLDGWLKLWTQAIGVIAEVPELLAPKEIEDGKWRFSSHSGGVFQEINLSGSLTDAKQWNEISANSLFGQLGESYGSSSADPVIQLGLAKMDRAAKKKIVTFIIRADTVVAANLPKLDEIAKFGDFLKHLQAPDEAVALLRQFWRNDTLNPGELAELKTVFKFFADSRPEEIIRILQSLKSNRERARTRERATGSDLLWKFIVHLAHSRQVFARLPGFNESRYFRNVIEIYNELLEDSEHTLKNQDTYLAVLDAAIGLQKRLLDRDSPTVKRNTKITRELGALGRTIQMKLLRPLGYVQMSESNAKVCEILLSPNPWARWRGGE